MKLLVIEDEDDLLDTLLYGLRKKGFAAVGINDGAKGLRMAQTGEYDLIVLDLNLPGIDGLDILREIRRNDARQRVLILSARSDFSQRIEGLELGANDYLVKPFDFGELVARIRGLLRRRFTQDPAVITRGGLCVDTARRQVRARNGVHIRLAAKEYMLLEYLLAHRGRAVPAEELILHIWQDDAGLFSNAIKVHMSQLRKKLLPYTGADFITTVRGAGYLIERDDQS
ncbi:MAG TPA: DNA-binding response regulator [Clostridiales bacterium]|nr:DNA-binding response regulator [Clostridiales bacterium]